MGKFKNYHFRIKTVVKSRDTVIFHVDTKPHLKQKGRGLIVVAYDKNEALAILKGETGKVHGGLINL